jgi:tRNA modification GTPase
MYATDTICAIATPPGEGGIGIIRISGDKAVEIASRVFQSPNGQHLTEYHTHTLHIGELRVPETGARLDEVLVAVMKAPHTYTREDVVEFHCHGSPLVLKLGLEALIRNGSRLAEPGEFTKRAFLNGRLDLAQAEAVMDLIQARSETGLRVAVEQLRGGLSQELGQIREALVRLLVELEAGIDFTEEGITFISAEALNNGIQKVSERVARLLQTADDGRVVREGVTAALVGRPNVGKSSLLNALARADRAIVTAIPGTTRDVLEEFVSIRGIPVRLLDTAGVREATDIVEREGVRRSHEALSRAELVIAVLDGSMDLQEEDRTLFERAAGKSLVIVLNKSDLPANKLDAKDIDVAAARIVRTSAITGTGLEELRDAIRDAVLKSGLDPAEGIVLTHLRHQSALTHAKESLQHVRFSIEQHMPAEFIAMDLRAAVNAVGEIIGETTVDDVLARIFSGFCIGK